MNRQGLRADLRLELPDRQRGSRGRQEAGAVQRRTATWATPGSRPTMPAPAPMKLREWRANEVVALERNDNYWGREVQAGAGDLPPCQGSRHAAPDAGKGRRRHRAQPVAAGSGRLASNKDIKTTATPKGTVYYISLNQKNPNLAKPEVREAFKWLVDYDAIGDTIIKNIGIVHQNFLPVGLLGASTENPYKLDVDKAKALLAKAGWRTASRSRSTCAPRSRCRASPRPSSRPPSAPASTSRSCPAMASRR
jgi:peptide/nickel transport system substrate-binding protein